MARLTLLSLSSVAVVGVLAQVPLAQKRFEYPGQIPYKVDTDNGPRGQQHGFNICNSTTESQTSDCQTSFIDSLEDFCLWGPPQPGSTIGDTEGEAVAWCTKPGRGTRVIPPGTITGVQFMRTPDYIQVVGTFDQTKINILAGDTGGEMDPHGADLRGNPLGGLLYSNAFPSNGGNKDSYQQVIEWHNFIGSDTFCLKACDPAGPDADRFCEHIYDRIGCGYNAPAKPFGEIEGTFESCEGENQDFPGIFTENGVVKTYTQPAESLGPISIRPYEPRVPASSNCVPAQSAVIYAAAASITGGVTASASATGTPSGSASGSPRPTSAPSVSRSLTGTGPLASATSEAGNSGAAALSGSIVVALAASLVVAFSL